MRTATIMVATVLLLSASLPPASDAQLHPGGDPFLRAFRALVTLVRDTPKGEYYRMAARDLRLRKLDEALHVLRGPDPASPTGYRHVRLERRGSYQTLGSAVVQARHTDAALQEIRGSVARLAYEVNLYVPRRRSKRRSNGSVYVRACRIVYHDRGQPRVIENAFTGWLPRGARKAIALPVFAQRVDVHAWIGAKAADVGRSYLRIRVALPTVVDLPTNPSYALVKDLLALRPTLESSLRQQEALAALTAIRGKLGARDEAAGEGFGFYRRLQYVLFLLDGDARDILRAKGELAALIDEMRARVPTPGLGITVPPVSRPPGLVRRPGRPAYGDPGWPPRPGVSTPPAPGR